MCFYNECMNSAVLLIGISVAFSAAYLFYAGFLARNFRLDPARKTPAHEFHDGRDYVPAKHWLVLFGHHFSSICGAGPIVGPALACAYWGWGWSVVWIVVGVIFMGAVADFSALVVSMREKGQSIAQISGAEISNRVKICFSIFLWITLILVISVFAIFAAKTLINEAEAVVPSLGLIPTAMIIGWLLYRTRFSNLGATLLGLAILIVLLRMGVVFPVSLPSFWGMDPEATWIIILLAYCFFASILPVQVLLQPRDYLASFILFAVIIIGVLSVLVTQPQIRAPVVTEFTPVAWPKAGPLWPMLFVTIACGAISGFHSVVASGTTSKQISSEAHACRIGYGGMLLESVVGVIVVISVCAGLQFERLTELVKGGGPISAFSHGYGSVTSIFLGDYGKTFAVLGLNAFILTTLDTATRITRYITSEILGVKNIYAATSVVVAASAILALTGKWGILWPLFGASNQLIAGMALLLASCWLLNRKRVYWMTLIPAFLMLFTTAAAFLYQFYVAWVRVDLAGKRDPDWLMMGLCALLVGLSLVIFADGLKIFRKEAASLQKARRG